MTDARRQERLKHLLAANGVLWAEGTDEADVVRTFQDAAGLVTDGVLGPLTAWELQKVLLRVPIPLTTVPVNPPNDRISETRVTLRDDVAWAYQNLAAEVRAAGGHMTSAGGLRRLTSGANSTRSALSHHYWAGAFDLGLPSGFFDPDRDPFVIERTGPRTWQVWARAKDAPERTVTATYWKSMRSGIDLTKEVTAPLLDFTALARKHGFQPIGPRTPFTRSSNRLYGGAEWWHFQYEAALWPGISQIGIEILRMAGVSEESFRKQNPGLWARSRSVFKEDWF